MKNKKYLDIENIEAIIDARDPILRRIKVNLEEIAKIQKEIEEERKRTEEERRKTEKEIAKMSKEIEKVNKKVGDLTDGWGKFVVGLTEPSIKGEFKKLGFKVLSIDSPPARRLNGRELEVDLLIMTTFNKKPTVIVVEVKSSLNQQKIQKFVDNQLKRFKKFFIEYENIDLIGGVAGVRFAKGAKEVAIKHGLYLFSTSKGIMVNMNPNGFKPKVW
ncbi:MAG: hypothetical protein AB1567_01655 [bacterium]